MNTEQTSKNIFMYTNVLIKPVFPSIFQCIDLININKHPRYILNVFFPNYASVHGHNDPPSLLVPLLIF